MSCPNFIEDTDRPCGDEGEMCEACYEAEAAYWYSQWLVTPADERDPKKYEQDMRDAGRGHLLPP